MNVPDVARGCKGYVSSSLHCGTLWEAIDAEEEQWEANPPSICGIAAFLKFLIPCLQVNNKIWPIEMEDPIRPLHVAFEHGESIQK